jgi:hypothetical protein
MSIEEIVAAVMATQQRLAATTPAPASPRGESAPVAANPPAEAEPVPHFFEGTDEQCTICVSEFRHNEQVCRLVCRHMYHSDCWHAFMEAQNRSPPGMRNHCCPNCRGAATMIANWRYIDPTLVTQRIPGQEQQAANELDMFAEHHEIDTPREHT